MGYSKEQLRRRERLHRFAVRRGRGCGAVVTFAFFTIFLLWMQTTARAGRAYDPAMDAKCVRALSMAQREFFQRRACEYDTSNAKADFIAAELALTVRKRHAPGPCVVMTLGLPRVTRSAGDVGSVEPSVGVDGGLAAKMGSWVTSMVDAGAFECETRTFVDEKAVDALRSTLYKNGFDNVAVEKLWNERKVGKQLDEEFEEARKRSPDAKHVVLINDAQRSRSQFARFRKGLSSGKVSTIIWRREITSKTQRKALVKEMQLVSRFGYSVYIAGAGVDAEGNATPTAYLRVDHGAWDDVFATPNTGIELTIVAVQQDDKFKTLLDGTFGLCPTKATARNKNESFGPSCACDEGKFVTAPVGTQCSLKSRMGSKSYFNWFWSFLSGRTADDVEGVAELDAMLERNGELWRK